MAEYCVVAPPHILEHLDKWRELGPTHLLLAHDIVKEENQGVYRRLFNRPYRSQLALPDNEFTHIILDNSVIETGNSVDADTIFRAAEIVRPSCIVLPDVLEDAEATIEGCSTALATWTTELNKTYGNNPRMRDMPFMYVPQGKTLKEFAKAAEALSRGSNRIRYWGVPRNLVALLGGRRHAIDTVQMLNDRRYVHMMGFSDDLLDDALCASLLDVDTIDSAVPLRTLENFGLQSNPGPRGDWWETAEFTPQMRINVDLARRLFGR